MDFLKIFWDVCREKGILVFQNEEIFIQLDELDELNKITRAWVGIHYSVTQAQKYYASFHNGLSTVALPKTSCMYWRGNSWSLLSHSF